MEKPYLPHPDSDLDVPYMNLDLLDETYPIVKSNLYFVEFDHTGLAGGTHRLNRSDQTCQFWVRTIILVETHPIPCHVLQNFINRLPKANLP
jgi:hypothetical protein